MPNPNIYHCFILCQSAHLHASKYIGQPPTITIFILFIKNYPVFCSASWPCFIAIERSVAHDIMIMCKHSNNSDHNSVSASADIFPEIQPNVKVWMGPRTEAYPVPQAITISTLRHTTQVTTRTMYTTTAMIIRHP